MKCQTWLLACEKKDRTIFTNLLSSLYIHPFRNRLRLKPVLLANMLILFLNSNTCFIPHIYRIPPRTTQSRHSLAYRKISMAKAKSPDTIVSVANPTKSYWIEQAASELRNHCTTTDLPEEVDVVIIGSGYTGATTAYWLHKLRRFLLELCSSTCCHHYSSCRLVYQE